MCIFCGAEGTMTGEDVLGQWLQRIDLDQGPVPHGTGWLNRIGRHIGTRPPYRQRIRDVCKACNSGWMSRLESTASRVLTPFILGTGGIVEGHDLGAIAAWVQKTCLTAMYISTADDRAAGYGLPASEYRNLYEIRGAQEPLSHSQFWMGRFNGAMAWSVRATPVVVVVDGLPEPEFPHGYLMTIVLGQLLLQGIRMTVPGLEVTAGTRQGMPRIWPDIGTAGWPKGDQLTTVVTNHSRSAVIYSLKSLASACVRGSLRQSSPPASWRGIWWNCRPRAASMSPTTRAS
jgi:hypothetical protein